RAALGHLIAFALRDRPRRWRRRRKGRDRRPARASARDARESQAHQARAKREKARVALEPMSEKSEVRGPKSEGESLLSLGLTYDLGHRTADLRDRVPFRARPMLATLVDEPFQLPGWVYEEKYDGYRILAYKEGNQVTLLSRNAKDRTES